MYKWFVWSVRLQKYIPILGLSSESRGANPAVIVDIFGDPLPPLISIPMFGLHNAVK